MEKRIIRHVPRRPAHLMSHAPRISLVIALAVLASAFPVNATQYDTITLLFTNDMHAQDHPLPMRVGDGAVEAGGFVALSSYIHEIRGVRPDTLLLDAGDHFTGTPLCTVTEGAAVVDIMNEMGYDVAVVGNHELDFGPDVLIERVDEANYTYVSANVLRHDELFAQPYAIFDVDGVKVGVIGITTIELSDLILAQHFSGLDVKDPVGMATYYAKTLEPHVDLTIVLSHEGVGDDAEIAQQVPYIDVIIGGHSGGPYYSPKVVNNVLITRTKERTLSLGRIDALVDLDKNCIVRYNYQLIPTWVVGASSPIPSVEEKVERYYDDVERELDVVIGELACDLYRGYARSPATCWTADVLLEWTEQEGVPEADFAVQNNGGSRRDLAAGPVTKRDLWELSPFGNYPAMFNVTGEQLWVALENHIARRKDRVSFSGIHYTYDSTKPKGHRLVEVTVGGEALELNRTYRGITNNFVAGHGQLYFGFDLSLTHEFPGVPIRDLEIAAFEEATSRGRRVAEGYDIRDRGLDVANG